MKIKFKKLDKSVPSPFKKYPSDFCWDLYATSCEKIAPNVYKYGLGIAIEMERDWETILKGSTIDMGLNTDIDLSKCPFHLSLDLRPRSSVWKTGMVLSNCEGTKDKLQQLCRKYLKKLYRKARDIGLDEFVERTITENENGRCTATVEQVNMLASLCGDDRIKREEIPNLLGLSYRKCNEQKIFKRIRKFKDKGIYSKVDAIILKDKMI